LQGNKQSARYGVQKSNIEVKAASSWRNEKHKEQVYYAFCYVQRAGCKLDEEQVQNEEEMKKGCSLMRKRIKKTKKK
jgi:hypothetical protein